ncbi:hypothetical protein [Pseudomonas sp.]|uniref:hypothetical protein n=1 Tax=Pseudomonas sp. TaxID=306 RepID=UPI002582DD95|nr:hypothetical protein [Pseudomonas sp.]
MTALCIAAAQTCAIAGDLAANIARHCGPTGGWQAPGRSALWDAQGRLVVAVNGAGEQLLVARRTGEGWQARVEGLVAEGGADAA